MFSLRTGTPKPPDRVLAECLQELALGRTVEMEEVSGVMAQTSTTPTTPTRDDHDDHDDNSSTTEAAEATESDGPMERVAGLGRDIGAYIRQQRNNAEISLRQLAKLAGVSNPYLSQIERGLRRPSAEILQQIAKGLRISAETLYVQAGILDRPVGGPVVDAVRADTSLTERQKQVLLDVYESFLRENRGKETVGERHPDQDHRE